VNLADWAESVGVSRHTAYRWFREGTLPVPAERVGRLILVRTAAVGDGRAGGVVVYARVSSHDQRADLDRQVVCLTAWVTGQALGLRQVVREVVSGLNGKRPKLRRVLSDPDARVIVVEHRDRLAPIGTRAHHHSGGYRPWRRHRSTATAWGTPYRGRRMDWPARAKST
jgi:putative resolvase